MCQNVTPSVPSGSAPLRCTIAGMSIVPWCHSHGVCGRGLRYPIRPAGSFAQSDSAMRFTCLVRGDCCPPGKGCNRAGPSSRDEAGVFTHPYFIIPKKGGGLRANPGSANLESALLKLPFKMLTQKRIIRCIQPQNWFAAVDLRDAYFHVLIALDTDRRFVFEGRAWQYRVLPFGLSLSPRFFAKVAEGALAPLREVGISILNCLVHGPRARTFVRSQGPGAPAPQPVGASGQLGKGQALPRAEKLFSQYGVRLGECGGASHQ